MASSSFEVGDFVIYNTGLRYIHVYISEVCGDRYEFIPNSFAEKKGKLYCVASQLRLSEKWPSSIPKQQNHDLDFTSTASTLEQISQLKVGDILDFADKSGKYCLAKVVEKSRI